MASENRPPDPSLEPPLPEAPPPYRPGMALLQQRLAERGYEFDFFQAVRLLERLSPDRAPVGRFSVPGSEVARFEVNQEMGFPASAIEGIEFVEGQPARVKVNFMGLTGPQGVLPLYYTELLRERLRARDQTAASFFDLFNHRIISLFYQAWEKYRFPIAYERGDRDRFSHHLLDLIGLGTQGLENRQPLPDDSLIFYTGLLSQRARSASALRNLVADYFDVPCEVEQFIGGWYPLIEETQCCLDAEDATISEQLGFGAVVGDEVYDQQSAVRIILGPLSLERYCGFLPQGAGHEPLKALVRLFGGPTIDFEVKLILAKEEVPECHLGPRPAAVCEEEEFALENIQLGWTSWVKTAPRQADAADAILRF
jgi:type VI secretion system protein ImpH